MSGYSASSGGTGRRRTRAGRKQMRSSQGIDKSDGKSGNHNASKDSKDVIPGETLE